MQREGVTVFFYAANDTTMAKKPTYTLQKDFVGHGHYNLTVIDEKGNKYSGITGNMDLIHRLNSEIEEEKEKAKTEAIIFVLNQ